MSIAKKNVFQQPFRFAFLHFVIGATVVLTSCASGQKVAKPNADLKPRTAKQLQKKLEEQIIPFESFEGKLKFDYQSIDQNFSAKMTVRIKRDSAIWASVTLLGIEGARIFITPDSVQIINRLEGQHIKSTIQFVEKMTNLPADFNALQDLIVGNPVLYNNPTPDNTMIKDQQYVLFGEGAFYRSYYLNGKNYALEGMYFEQSAAGQKLDISLSQHKLAEKKRRFAYFREIYVSSKETGELRLTLDFTKVEFNQPKSMPFEIPEKYETVVY